MKKKTGAYLTVEASLLMPIILGVILLVVYLLFFQYDRCLMEQNTGVLAMRGCTLQMTDKKSLMAEIVYNSEKKDKRYLAWVMEDAIAVFKGNRVRLERKGALKFPFRGLMFWCRDTQWGCMVVFENYRIQPVNFIRNYRKVIGGGN